MGQQEEPKFTESLNAIPLEVRLFCLLKTTANFGAKLNWQSIQAALQASVDMQLLSEKDVMRFNDHMREVAIKHLRSEKALANVEENSAALDRHVQTRLSSTVLLRPRQVITIL